MSDHHPAFSLPLLSATVWLNAYNAVLHAAGNVVREVEARRYWHGETPAWLNRSTGSDWLYQRLDEVLPEREDEGCYSDPPAALASLYPSMLASECRHGFQVR